MPRNLTVQILNSAKMEVDELIDGRAHNAEHKVGHLTYRVYFTDTGVSVQTDNDDKVKNFEYQLLLSPHGTIHQSVDITCKRTDR